jgi:recombination protein RecR
MSDPVGRLVAEFSKLPGVGEKTAMRLAYFVLRAPENEIEQFARTLMEAKQNTRLCERCFTFTQDPVCALCLDPKRSHSVVCVVEKPADVFAIENSQKYFGRYHVLHGVLSPLDGIGPDQLRLRELLLRFQTENIEEVILAMNPSVEGEATSIYLTKLLRPLSLKISRIAHGIPVGGVLEYVDRQTIGRAIENRVSLEK